MTFLFEITAIMSMYTTTLVLSPKPDIRFSLAVCVQYRVRPPRIRSMVCADLSERQMSAAIYLSCNFLPPTIPVAHAMHRILMRYRYNFCCSKIGEGCFYTRRVRWLMEDEYVLVEEKEGRRYV
jgi:hypothetical protein